MSRTLCASIAFMVVLSATALWAQVSSTPRDGSDALPHDIAELFDAGQYRQAAEALQAAVKANPNDPALYFWLGRSFFESRDFSHSVSSFERAVALVPGRSEYHDWLGRAYGRKAEETSRSNAPAALPLAKRTHREFQTAVQLDPMNIDAQRDLVDFMANAPRDLGGGEDNALKQIHALSAVDPLQGELALGGLYATKKKFDLADREYQSVLNSASNRADDYFEVADYYRDRADAKYMSQAVEAAAKIAPSDRRLDYYHGVILVLENENLPDAEQDLRHYIDAVPENSDLPSHSSAYEWLGKAYENENKPDLAAAQYRAALAIDPQDKAAREALKKLQ